MKLYLHTAMRKTKFDVNSNAPAPFGVSPLDPKGGGMQVCQPDTNFEYYPVDTDAKPDDTTHVNM
eukprot:14919734-Heterocapsa_arctica.AAC.1